MRASKTVVVADDDPLVAMMISDFLKKKDFGAVVTAHNGEEALQAFRSHCPDVMLVDLEMPVLDGYAVLETVRQESPATPVIVISGADHIKAAIRALRSGAWDYLTKPFETFDILLHSIETALERSRLMLENMRYQKMLEHEIANRNKEIIKRNKTEQNLLCSNERIRSFMESVPDAILSVNRRGEIIYCNKAAEKIFGYCDEELLGMNVQLLVPEHLRQNDRARMEEFFLRGHPTKLGKIIESQWIRKDGSVIHGEFSLAHWVHDEETFITAIIRDITERRKLEVELATARRLESIGQLAAGIAHEINTPIQYVGDNTRFLQDAFNDLLGLLATHERLFETVRHEGTFPRMVSEIDAVAAQCDRPYLQQEIPAAIQQSLEGVERISSIVRAMKDFSHPGGREKTLTDINKAIETTITISRNEWKYVSDVKTDLDPNLPLVACLPDELNQVILNLIVNASHAIGEVVTEGTSERGAITISTGCDGRMVEVTVSDTGSGIPRDIQDRIFDPFFTTKEVGRGTGQGLAIVRAIIVERHAGTIDVRSTQGCGTTFVMRLPLSTE